MTDYNELKNRLNNAIAMCGHVDVMRDHVTLWKDSLDHIAQLEANAKSLHIKLAGETLRADQGWERYEYANKSHVSAIAKSASKEAE